MNWFPFVSRARFEDAQKQIEALTASNAQLLALALNKEVAAAKEKEEEEFSTRPRRPLVKDLRQRAEKELSDKAKASGKAK
ncbi:MAG: hypothetical protein WB608_01410 [Terracidiphilus sp.]